MLKAIETTKIKLSNYYDKTQDALNHLYNKTTLFHLINSDAIFEKSS